MKIDWTLIDVVVVGAKPPGVWQLVYDYVAGSRLLRLRVVDKDAAGATVSTTWQQNAQQDPTIQITADGIPNAATKNGLLLGSAPRGALIGKIGGGTADLPDSANASTPYGGKKVFAVGTYCVVKIAAAESGPLFMAMNDSLDSKDHHVGALHVAVEEYLL